MERHRKKPGNRSEFRTKETGRRRTVKFRIQNMRVPRNLVGPVVRELREQAGLTQPMLVARLNLAGWDISRETLAKIESQIRWLADFELVRFAEALSVPISRLFEVDAKKTTTTKDARKAEARGSRGR